MLSSIRTEYGTPPCWGLTFHAVLDSWPWSDVAEICRQTHRKVTSSNMNVSPEDWRKWDYMYGKWEKHFCLSLKCSWKSIDHTRAGSCLQGKHLHRWRENFEWQVLRRCSVSSRAPGARHWQVKLSVQFEQIRCIYILDKCIVTRTNSAETAIVAKVFQSHREVNTGWG